MTNDLAIELHRYEEMARQLEGWVLQFPPETLTPGPPWDYEARARELALQCRALLDLGTGGGEVLSRILEGVRCSAFAMEEWLVNAPVAARRLGRLAPVVRASSLRLPFRDRSLDLVLSRHEAIDPHEVARVLAAGGRFLTQQVIPNYLDELRHVFPEMVRFPDHFTGYQDGFRDAGLTIDDARIHRMRVEFRELGHLVHHLVAAPWMIPDFGVDSHIEGLRELDRQMREGRKLEFTAGYYILEVSRGA